VDYEDAAVTPAGKARAQLELNIVDPMQLFNSMDPSPFHERELDSEVVEYIVDWAQEVAPEAPLELVVTVHYASPPADGARLVSDAVQASFQRRALSKRRELKKLLREGRISLVIGIAFLAAAIFISDYLAGMISNENYAWLVQESVVIGGWVALWHPMNIFLYEWWPLRAERRLFERLALMQVNVINTYVAPATASS
jgi:hypothetical protein